MLNVPVLSWLLALVVSFSSPLPAPRSVANAQLGEPILRHATWTMMDYRAIPSGVQGAMPGVEFRGVNVDGSERSNGFLEMDLAGNAYGSPWRGTDSHNSVLLTTGAVVQSAVDLSLSADGPTWEIGRSYNSGQVAGYVSDGYQGKNWFQAAQPEIQLAENAGDHSQDTVYLILGVDRFAEFERTSGSSDTYVGTNGATGVFVRTPASGGQPELWTLTDAVSTTYTFFGFDGLSGLAAGQIWKKTDAGGVAAYAGHEVDPLLAQQAGYEDGRLRWAFDSEDRRFEFFYVQQAAGSPWRLASVNAQEYLGSSWSNPGTIISVGSVDYEYVSSGDAASIGNLAKVTVTSPLSQDGVDDVRITHYRYWDVSSRMRYLLDPEAYRLADLDGDGLLNGSPDAMSDSAIEPFAASYWHYDGSGRCDVATVGGGCGCGGGSDAGVHNYQFESNASFVNTSGYDLAWKTRAVLERPGGRYLTQYFDETGQCLDRIESVGVPGSSTERWLTKVVRGSDGTVRALGTPAGVSGYDHLSGTTTFRSDSGLIWLYNRTSAGTLLGFLTNTQFLDGLSSAPLVESSQVLTTHSLAVGATSLHNVTVSESWSYSEPTSSVGAGPGATVTTRVTLWHTGTLVPSESITTAPAVSIAHHGSGLAQAWRSAYDLAGRKRWSQDASGIVNYTDYEQGRTKTSVVDADPSLLAYPFPSGWSATPGAFHRVTSRTYDRADEVDVLYPDQTGVRNHVSRLVDGRIVHLSVPYSLISGLTFGVTSVGVQNQAGYSEAAGELASYGLASLDFDALVDENQSDPLQALTGTVSSWSTRVLDLGGTRALEARSYFQIPASGEGTPGTHYDRVAYSYNDTGDQVSTLAASGTVTWNTRDGMGRITGSWIGTNTEGMDVGGVPSGSGNMTLTEFSQYDFGQPGGNGYVTQHTSRLGDTSQDERITRFWRDVRGRLVATENPDAPHSLIDVDHLGRAISRATYSSAADLSSARLGSGTASTAGRLSLAKSSFDDQGHLYKSRIHGIDQNTGQSIATLDQDNWFDSSGQVVKSVGERLIKRTFDRLGRVTHSFDLADLDGDIGYADAFNVAGDVVMAESQTVYESGLSDRVLMDLSIARWPGANGPNDGELDSNGDGSMLTVTGTDVTGRYQIDAHWYDALGRRTESVTFGDNARAVFYRGGSPVPPRSDVALRTSRVYGMPGRLTSVLDPKAIETRYSYDSKGRQTTVIENYVTGQPSAANPDQDRTIHHTFEDGLRTQYTVELATASMTTTYIYGTAKSALPGSKIATGHLLSSILYPLASTSPPPPTELYAYDAQQQTIWKENPSGTQHEYHFDALGRTISDRAIQLAVGVDSAVRRRDYSYNARGQMTDAIQYADVAANVATDAAQYEFNDWGGLSRSTLDPDSAVGASGEPARSIDYGFEQAPIGRRLIRPTTTTYPSGEEFTLIYDAGPDFNDRLSRASRFELGTPGSNDVVVEWDYLGWGQIVGVRYPQAGISMSLMGANGTTMPSVDRFGRRTKVRWNRSTLLQDVTLLNLHYGYDRGSYLVSSDDKLLGGFDEELELDGLGRIIRYDRGEQLVGTFTNLTYRMDRSYDALGNMLEISVDKDGDGLYTGTGESFETRTFNDVGEISTRTSTEAGVGNPTWRADGSIQENGEGQQSTFDAWGNLVRVEDASNGALIVHLRRDALDRIIEEHSDRNADGMTNATDPILNFLPDNAGRALATYQVGKSTPQIERLYPGPQGLVGVRESRDDDSDGTHDRMTYVLPDATSSAGGFFDSSTGQMERVHYNPMGVPTCLPSGDINADGKTDMDDYVLLREDVENQTYDDTSDTNADGVVDVWDAVNYVPKFGGTGVLSLTGNVLGLHAMRRINSAYFARARVFDESMGRWSSPDPAGFLDGPSRYLGMRGNLFAFADASGLASTRVRGAQGEIGNSSGDPGIYVSNPGGGGDIIISGPGGSGDPPIPPIDDKKAECCKTAGETQGNGNPPTGGKVVCCGGEQVVCIWNLVGGLPDPIVNKENEAADKKYRAYTDAEKEEFRAGMPGAQSGLAKCADKHEGRHMGKKTPPELESCTGKKNGHIVDWAAKYKGKGKAAKRMGAEWPKYQKEHGCIRSKINETCNKAGWSQARKDGCKWAMNSRIHTVLTRAAARKATRDR